MAKHGGQLSNGGPPPPQRDIKLRPSARDYLPQRSDILHRVQTLLKCFKVTWGCSVVHDVDAYIKHRSRLGHMMSFLVKFA